MLLGEWGFGENCHGHFWRLLEALGPLSFCVLSTKYTKVDRRSAMTPTQRRAISKAMKKYWRRRKLASKNRRHK